MHPNGLGSPGGPLAEEQLLAEMAWVRRLARALLRDRDAAEDVAQDAWVVAQAKAPPDRPLRPWLSRVVLNLVRMRGRSHVRRAAREERSRDDVEAVPTASELVERVEMQRIVAAEVIALPEPSRSTILLRYVEGLSSVEIARRLGVPDATVRKRIERALAELRGRLDDRDDAPSGGWVRALVPLAALPFPHVTLGALAMKKLVAAIVVAVIAMILVVGWHIHARSTSARDDDISAESSSSRSVIAPPQRGMSGRGVHDDDVITLPSWIGQPGLGSRRIAGRVVVGDTPVADAIVRLGIDLGAASARTRGDLGSMALTQIAVARTSSSGAFDLGLQPAAAFVVSAEVADAAPASISLRTSDPRVDSEHVVIGLGDCHSRLVGTVRDAASPIAGARIRAAGLAGTNADADGHYALCVRRTAMTGVTVEADGYGSVRAFLPSLFGELHHDFVLVPEATLAGVVVDDDGSPVASAAIIAMPAMGQDRHDTAPITTISGADGRFQLARLALGAYELRATADHASTPEQPIVVTPGAGTEVRLVVSHRWQIRGHVRMAGAPVAGAEVSVLRGKRINPSAISQRDGSFELVDLEPGTVVLAVTPYEVRAPTSVTVGRRDLSDVTLEVIARASLRGKVIGKQSPVANARVSWSLDPSIGAFSDASGAYVLEGLTEGSGRVEATTETAFGGTRATLAARESRTLDITVANGGEVRGIVVDATGAPVPAVFVALDAIDQSDGCESMTDATGGFRCASLAGRGDYQPAVFPTPSRGAPFKPTSGDRLDRIHVSDDGVVTGVRLAIAVERLTIRGRVIDDSGAPVPDVNVRAIGIVAGNEPLRARGDADGNFALTDLVRGIYSLRAHAPDGSEAEVAGIAAGSTTTVITLAHGGQIEGTLTGFTTPPSVIAETPLGDLDTPHQAIITGDRFTFASMPAGTYNVVAMSGGVQLVGIAAEVRAGKTTRVALQPARRVTIDGRLVDTITSTPIPNAICFGLVSVDGSEAAFFDPPVPHTTDATGRFTADVSMGHVRLRCSLPGGGTHSEGGGDFDITGPKHVELTLVKQVSPPSAVDFRVAPWTIPATVIFADTTSGLVIGDRIITVDGTATAAMLPGTAMTLVQNHRPGSPVPIQIIRDGATITVQVPVR